MVQMAYAKFCNGNLHKHVNTVIEFDVHLKLEKPNSRVFSRQRRCVACFGSVFLFTAAPVVAHRCFVALEDIFEARTIWAALVWDGPETSRSRTYQSLGGVAALETKPNTG